MRPRPNQRALPSAEAARLECFPCPFCPQRVFLTHGGLERHGLELHSDRLAEIGALIQRVRKVWAFLDFDARAPPPVLRDAEQQEMFRTLASQAPLLPVRRLAAREPADELCRRCGLLYGHPSSAAAADAHRKLHECNDELRRLLEETAGADRVRARPAQAPRPSRSSPATPARSCS